ncbi:MAG: calcium/proton exchanger [Planctomycetota bacterium]|nr:calcium/proton exchanger [Planctomycetota bacterium]
MLFNVLLVFVPIAIVLRFAGADPLWVFAASALAIVPLSDRLANSTEKVAGYLGSTLGGLLNASLGNAPEIIIGAFALKNGLQEVVKASLTGSLLVNLLLAPGLAMAFGGWKREKQSFNPVRAGTAAILMLLASVGLIIPSLFKIASRQDEEELSLLIAIILFVLYGLSLYFSLGTHRKLFNAPAEADSPHKPAHEASRSPAELKKSLVWLGISAVLLAVVSEMLTDALDEAAKSLGLGEVFAGVIVVGMLGSVSSVFAAIRFAKNDNLDLAIGVTLGAAQQVALVVAPLLLFLSYAFGPAMNLLFTPFEVVSITLAVLIVSSCTRDGESNWFEGALLTALYLMFAVGFYFLPVSGD